MVGPDPRFEKMLKVNTPKLTIEDPYEKFGFSKPINPNTTPRLTFKPIDVDFNTGKVTYEVEGATPEEDVALRFMIDSAKVTEDQYKNIGVSIKLSPIFGAINNEKAAKEIAEEIAFKFKSWKDKQ